MTGKISFTKYEHECLPAFRQRINKAESIEDVRKVFGYTTRYLMEKVFSGEAIFRDEDVILDLSEKSSFSLSSRVLSAKGFKSTWDNSDLPRMVRRFAETAARRIKHLEKHPEKTDAKIRM
jgi:aspartokinase